MFICSESATTSNSARAGAEGQLNRQKLSFGDNSQICSKIGNMSIVEIWVESVFERPHVIHSNVRRSFTLYWEAKVIADWYRSSEDI